MGAGSSYKMVVDQSTGRKNDSDLDWIAKPPKEGETRVSPLFEKDLVAGDGPILGKGAYGVTRLAKSSFTGEYYAVKVMNKAPVLEKKTTIVVQAEIDTLARMQHPFIVHLFAVHQDDVRCMLVLEYAAGGELLHRIRKRLRLPDGEAKFYAAEIADALQYMHNEAGIIYHDLKPENILLAADGHVKVVDFGLALDAEARQWDECRMGTSMYMAPELAKHRVQGAHAPAVDWWSFGCVVYEMLSGKLPFGDSADLSKYEIYTNITEKRLRFGKGFGRRSRGLLRRLLDKNPETRMGWEGVKEHKWFRNVDWEALHDRRVFPPWIPPSMKPGCTQCFLQWKPEPAIGAGGGGGGDRQQQAQHSSLPDQAQQQNECCFARIKIPPGCALRPPPPTPQPSSPGQARRNGSREMNGTTTSNSFQRAVIEPPGVGRPSFKNSAHAPPATGRNSSASTGSSTAVVSLDHSAAATAISKRGSNEGEGGDGGGGVGRRCQGAASSNAVGSPGGGNAKRRFKSAAARVAAGDGRYATTTAGGAGSHRDATVPRNLHRRASPGSSGNGGGAGSQRQSAPLCKPSPAVKKQRGAVAYR